MRRFESPLKVTGSKAHTLWGVNTAIADAAIEHAQNRKLDLVVLTSIMDIITKPGIIGPHIHRLLNTLRVPVLNIKGVIVHHLHWCKAMVLLLR